MIEGSRPKQKLFMIEQFGAATLTSPPGAWPLSAVCARAGAVGVCVCEALRSRVNTACRALAVAPQPHALCFTHTPSPMHTQHIAHTTP